MMALYRRVGNNAVKWDPKVPLRVGSGQPIRYPPTIERLWLDEELAAIGLFRPAPPDPVPEGQREVSRSVRIVQGRPKIVLELEDVPPLTADEVLQIRDRLLRDTDFHFLTDSPAPPAGMDTYRQALRDVPAQPGFPDNVVWPVRPAT
jgi:hypothetical protein